MTVAELIQAVKEGSTTRAKEVLDAGVDVNAHGDEQEWTPLNYASGKGDVAMVSLLLERGADVFNTGRDRRTPYEIALAAGQIEVARLLRETEDKVDPERAKTSSRRPAKYCKAYYLRDLRQFPGWVENEIDDPEQQIASHRIPAEPALPLENEVGFLHTDLTVTKFMWHGENIIFDRVTPEWKTFCSKVLKFKVPDDLDVGSPASAVAAN